MAYVSKLKKAIKRAEVAAQEAPGSGTTLKKRYLEWSMLQNWNAADMLASMKQDTNQQICTLPSLSDMNFSWESCFAHFNNTNATTNN